MSRKNVLKKALSNILEDNDFIFSDYKNSKENIENSENNFTLNKNINSSPEIENSIRECTLTHSLPHKKISIDGMNVFGFDIDLESKDRINIV